MSALMDVTSAFFALAGTPDETEGGRKHLPGRHDQSSHGRRGPKLPKVPDIPDVVPTQTLDVTPPRAPRKPRRAPTRTTNGNSGGIRDALRKPTTAKGVSAAAQKESERLTEFGVHFDLDGADPEIARDLAEGVLRGLERFPHADLSRVRLSSKMTNGEDVLAEVIGDEILINADWASDRDRFRSTMKQNHAEHKFVGDSPMATAIHEFGHVVAQTGDAEKSAGQLVMRTAAQRSLEFSEVRGFIESQISAYGAFNEFELTAEAFADVMLHGDKASELSKLIFDHLEDRYRQAVRR